MIRILVGLFNLVFLATLSAATPQLSTAFSTKQSLDAEWSPKVSVRLFKNEKSLKVSGYRLSWYDSQGHITKPLTGRSIWNIRVKKDKAGQINWHFQSVKKKVRTNFFVKGVRTLRFVARDLEINNHSVPPKLKFVYKSHAKNKIDVIATLLLDDYLKGVLPNEMPIGWPIEALKAQVVASRTYTLFQLGQRQSKSFHLEASVLDQVYKYRHTDDLLDGFSEKIDRAIRETEGYLLGDGNESVVPAYYHADCGGQTERPHNVWHNHRPGATVKDALCPLSPLGRWQRQVSWKDLSEKLSRPDKAIGDHWVKIKVKSRTASGRVGVLSLRSQTGQNRRISANEFRKALGFGKVKSTLFYLKIRGDGIYIYGRGHGHGVGMCQYGARALASRGLGYKAILRHYYPKAQLKWKASWLQAER